MLVHFGVDDVTHFAASDADRRIALQLSSPCVHLPSSSPSFHVPSSSIDPGDTLLLHRRQFVQRRVAAALERQAERIRARKPPGGWMPKLKVGMTVRVKVCDAIFPLLTDDAELLSELALSTRFSSILFESTNYGASSRRTGSRDLPLQTCSSSRCLFSLRLEVLQNDCGGCCCTRKSRDTGSSERDCS